MHHLVATTARRALPFVLLAAAACGSPAKSPSPAPGAPTPPPTNTGNTVTGSERIGWDQPVLAGTAPSEYTYAWFVDGLRAGPASAQCSVQSDTTLSCSAPLPKLTPGTHQLRLSAARTLREGTFESSRSEPLTVVQLGSTVPALTSEATAVAERIAGDHVSAMPMEPGRTATERVSVVARGFAPISDVAVASDLVIVAERQGTLRVVRGGSMGSDPSLALVDVVANAPGLGLLAVAVHPGFADNRHVYFVYTAAGRGGPVYRLARGREVGGRIGEVAVLLDGIEAAPAGWAALRFGPDGKLYAAFAPVGAARSGSYAGRVLRLNDDGTTPRDNPGGTPAIAAIGGTPLALVWGEGGELGIVRALADGRRDWRRSLAQAGAIQPWRATEQPAGATHYLGGLLPELSGRLLVGMMDGGIGLIDSAAPAGGVTRRIAATYGAVRALAVAESGEIYAGTANGDLLTPAASPRREDVLLAVTGERR